LRILRVLCFGGIGTLLLAACGGGTSTGTTLASNQTLTFPILADFGSLDPAVSDSETDQEIQQNMFDGLVKFDNNLNVIPDLAASMPAVSTDGLKYTFKLLQNVTFSNGDKLTSKDVLYSWNRSAAMQGSYATNLSGIAGYNKVANNTASGAALEALLENNDPSVTLTGLTAPDPYTVVVNLSAPAGWFLPAIALAGATGEIVDIKAVKQDFNNWWTNPATAIGTGPYKMVSRIPKQSVDFEAIPNWWGSPKPTVTKVHLDVSVNDASTAITKYEQGGYDIYGYGGYSNAPVADILRIQSTPNEKAQLTLHPKVRSTWVSFSVVSDGHRQAKGPFDLTTGQSGHDLRLAFALAIDKKKLVSVVCQNIVCTQSTGGLIVKGLTGYLGDNTDPLALFDPAKAKQLLQSADPGGTKTKGLTYTYDPENPLNKPVAEFLQAGWHDNLGIDVAIVGCPDSGCTTGYDPPAYDTLLAKADAETGDQAIADYKQLSQMLINDVIYIPLYYSVGSFLIKPYVKGAGTNSFFDYYWDQIQILSH
jgi:ABC-type transport system substrate-binding protein